jgi:CHAT domain-containing protein
MKTRFLIPLVLVMAATALLAGGCFQMEPFRQDKAEDASTRQETFLARRPRADDILVYLQSVLTMPAAQQTKEFEQAQLDFTRSGKPEDRLRTIGLSLLPGRPLADRANAARMLDEYLADPKREQGGLEGLATLFKMQLSEQRALQKQLSAEKDRADSLTRQVNEQKTQLDELKTQLNELKKIEKIISDREKGGLPEKQ